MRQHRKRIALIVPAVAALALLSWQVRAAGLLGLGASTVDGGGGAATGGTLAVHGTAGQPDAGIHTGGLYELQGGFWPGVPFPSGTANPPRVPELHTLHPPVPNPFNPRTTARFELARAGHARLEIHDAQGRLVRVLLSGDLPAGTHEQVWDGIDDRGTPVSSGSYYLRLVADGQVRTQKMALIK